jgi:hypothetical protein
MKTALIVVGDTHTNSTVGLCAPDVIQDDGGKWKLSKSQTWLWNNWLDFASIVKNTEADRKIVVFNGDLGEIDDKGRSSQLITDNDSTVLKMMTRTFDPLVSECDEVLVIRGTEAHASKSGAIEEAYAQTLGSKAIKHDEDICSWYSICFTIENVRFDIAHHMVGGGHLPWTEKNAANRIASLTIPYYVDMGVAMPNVVLRSHLHRMSDSGTNFEHLNLRALVLPAWQLKTSYVYRIGRENTVSHIGGYIFVCENGKKYELTRCVYTPEPMKWITI